MIEEIKKSALNNKVPIMKDEGIKFLIGFIKENKIKERGEYEIYILLYKYIK